VSARASNKVGDNTDHRKISFGAKSKRRSERRRELSSAAAIHLRGRRAGATEAARRPKPPGAGSAGSDADRAQTGEGPWPGPGPPPGAPDCQPDRPTRRGPSTVGPGYVPATSPENGRPIARIRRQPRELSRWRSPPRACRRTARSATRHGEIARAELQIAADAPHIASIDRRLRRSIGEIIRPVRETA